MTGPRPETLRQALASGRPLFGAWVQMPNPVGAEILGRTGFDWVAIDMQHGLIGFDGMLAQLQALSISGVPAIVRVSGNVPGEIMRALDAGAQGVMVPQLETAEEAERLVAACRYPPLGSRSYASVRPALEVEGYSPGVGNEYVVCIPQVESARGVENLDEILSVPGIDAVFAGPSDLAVSLGLEPGHRVRHPEHDALLGRIRAACAAHGVPFGNFPPDVAATGEHLRLGDRMLVAYLDLPALRRGAAAALAGCREAAPVA